MKVLIVRTGAMGDVIHGMHAVAGLRATMPEVEIGWAVEPHWEPLLRAMDGSFARLDGECGAALVQRVHRAETKAWGKAPLSAGTAGSVMRLRRELRSQRYDLAIDLQGSVRSAAIAWMSGAGEVVGLADPREAPARWMYGRKVGVRAAHVIAQAAEILSAAVGREIAPVERMAFAVDAGSAAWARILFAGDERPVAMLAPRAGWGAKEWGAERFGALAARLADRGYRVLVNALPGGDAVAAAVVTASGGVAEPVECSLRRLIALVSRLRLFVGGDTGPLHLAAASGVSVVALFGPTDPARTGPWGSRRKVLRDASSVTSHKRVAETESGLARIRVEDVLRAVESL